MLKQLFGTDPSIEDRSLVLNGFHGLFPTLQAMAFSQVTYVYASASRYMDFASSGPRGSSSHGALLL
jgi:hypothetical protein